MNPYYMLFFAPAVEARVRKVGKILEKHGYVSSDLDALTSRDLGRVVAEGMFSLACFFGIDIRHDFI
jgi:hypothetical protein